MIFAIINQGAGMHKCLFVFTGSIFLLVAGILGLAGCGNQAPARPVEQIVVWHWMTDRHEALSSLARKYEQQTGVRVQLELFAPSDTYTQKITAAAQAGVLPDVYGILDRRSILAAFIKAGLVADLTDELMAGNRDWEMSFVSKALDVSRFSSGNVDGVKPGIYGIPLDVSNIQMVYNRALLRKAGISKPPAVFDELMVDIDKLRRVGVVPFVSGFGEMWMVDCFASNYAFNILGADKVMATYRGQVKYTDPGWIRVFGLFRTLARKGAFIEGIVTKGNKYAEQDFALGRAAFAFNGSWCVNVYNKMNPGLEYGVAPLPAVNPNYPVQSWGGAGSTLVVNGGSPRRDKAVAFLKWLTAREQQVFLVEKTLNLPASRDAMAVIPSILADFARAVDNSTHPGIWPVNEDPLVSEAFVKGIQAIIIGEKTPEAVAAEVQAVKVRRMKKANR